MTDSRPSRERREFREWSRPDGEVVTSRVVGADSRNPDARVRVHLHQAVVSPGGSTWVVTDVATVGAGGLGVTVAFPSESANGWTTQRIPDEDFARDWSPRFVGTVPVWRY